MKASKFIFSSLSDLYNILRPINNSGEKGYAFIVHPRTYGDIVRNLPFLKIVPKSVVLKLFPYLWPFTVSSITGLRNDVNGKEIPGWVIGVPLLPDHLLENRSFARKKISHAIKLAQQKGATVIGLGALTGSVTEGGAGLTKKGEVLVTAGRAYTTHTIISYVDDVIRTFQLDTNDLTVAIVGAAGGVGTAVSRILAKKKLKKIILVDLERKLENIYKLINQIKPQNEDVIVTHQIKSVKEGDIIITVTNAPEAIVQSDDIKPGAIIIDDAQPSDISKEVINNRDDIVVIEAGVIHAPNIHVHANFRLANKNETYCCLGEVMCLAASNWHYEYKPGDITPDIVNEISNIAKHLGFKLAPYQAFGKTVSKERIERVRAIIKKQTPS